MTMMKRRIKSRPTPAASVGTADKHRRSGAEVALMRQFLSVLKSGGDARLKKVKRIRQSVRTRSYENDLKLSIAAERMAGDL
jgi:hypothetical protein